MRRALKGLTLKAALNLLKRGGVAVDVRAAADFASAHLKGSLNIGLDGKFATWAGTVLERGRPLVLIAPPGRH